MSTRRGAKTGGYLGTYCMQPGKNGRSSDLHYSSRQLPGLAARPVVAHAWGSRILESGPRTPYRRLWVLGPLRVTAMGCSSFNSGVEVPSRVAVVTEAASAAADAQRKQQAAGRLQAITDR